MPRPGISQLRRHSREHPHTVHDCADCDGIRPQRLPCFTPTFAWRGPAPRHVALYSRLGSAPASNYLGALPKRL